MNKLIVVGLAVGIYFLVKLDKKLAKLECKAEDALSKSTSNAVNLQMLKEESQINNALIYGKFKKLTGEGDE